MAIPRVSSNSIIRVFGTMTYNGVDAINIFKKIFASTESISDIKYYDEYIIQQTDRWDSIAYKFYETVELWWLIAAYNGIKDPFTSLVPGEKIKIIKPTFVPSILIELRGK